ncbi:teneurin-m-like isoform X3 [Cherax quadricarinatus]
MSRLNGRVHNSGPPHGTSAQYQAVPIQYHQGAPVQYQGSQGHPEEFEPSCLVRTPSGNVYIPSDMPKTSTLEYKSGLHSPSLHSPVKGDAQKAMEGYNVQFGGGLPAPVLPVRNNLRRPGPGAGPRGVGGPSSSGGRGPGSPRCSWRCTAIIFITIAVVLAAILIYIAATSSLAWSTHGGCAVLVDEETVITDKVHPGQAASRGNPFYPLSRPLLATHHTRQPSPVEPLQQLYLVFEPLPEGAPAPPGPGAPPRRMRRSVQHDLLPPASMGTHSPHSPSSHDPSPTPLNPDLPASDTPNPDLQASDTRNTDRPASDTRNSDLPASDTRNSDLPASDTPILDSPYPLADSPIETSHHPELQTLTTPGTDSNSPTHVSRDPLSSSPVTQPHSSSQTPSSNTHNDRNAPSGMAVGSSHAHVAADPTTLAPAGRDPDRSEDLNVASASFPHQYDHLTSNSLHIPTHDKKYPLGSSVKVKEHHFDSILRFGKTNQPREALILDEDSGGEERPRVKGGVQFKTSEKWADPSVSGSDTSIDSQAKILHEKSDPADDVFDPVIDVVEYSDGEAGSELPDSDIDVGDDVDVRDDVDSDEVESVGDDVDSDGVDIESDAVDTDSDDSDADEVINSNSTSETVGDGGEDYAVGGEEVKAGADYVYGHNPENEDTKLVEYEQDTERPPTEYPQAYEAIPSVLLVTNLGNNTPEHFPESMIYMDPYDAMLGDDPSAYSSHRSHFPGEPSTGLDKTKLKRRNIPLRSWMASFPTLETYVAPEADSDTQAERKSSGNTIVPGATWFSRPSASTSGSNKTDKTSSSRTRKINPHRAMSSVDTWFSRYGRDTRQSTDDAGDPIDEDSAEDDKRLMRRSAAQGYGDGKLSFDPNDPQGGPIPQSDPRSFPSKILESLGVPHFQDSKSQKNISGGGDNETDAYKGSRMAKDVFPHIFDYDLNEHDDYYYDDEVNYYYFDDYSENNGRAQKDKTGLEDVTEEEESDDVILDTEDNVGKAKAGYRDPKMVVTLNSMPERLQMQPTTSAPISATHYPPGLRALSLTKEEFHIAIPEPQVKALPEGQDEVLEIEVVPLYSKVGSAVSFENGPNYSPTNNKQGGRETTTTERGVKTTTNVPSTRPPTPAPITTDVPAPAPSLVLDPSLGQPKASVPLQAAKFMPTPESISQHYRSSEFSHWSDSNKKIPKFLMHKTGQNPSLPRSIYSDYNVKTTEAPNPAVIAEVLPFAQPAASSSPIDPRYHASVNQTESSATSRNKEASIATGWSSQIKESNHINVAEREQEAETPEKPINSEPPAQEHPRELKTSVEYSSRGKDLDSQVSSATKQTHRSNRSPQVSDLRHLVPSSARHSKRVTVNVTIETEGESQMSDGGIIAKKPLYVLSVSVPTSGKDQEADITLVEPDEQQQIASLSLTILGNKTHDIHNQNNNPVENIQRMGSDMLSPIGSVNRISGPKEAGRCQCPCPCSDSSSSRINSIPIPPNFLPDTHKTDTPSTETGSLSSDDADSQTLAPKGCGVEVSAPTTPPPQLPPWVEEQLKDHKNRPQKTIPPDGTTFKMMELGEQLVDVIPPYGYWNMQFYQSESAYVRFDVSIPRGSSIGVYGRRNALPTHTSYDFLQVLSGYKTGTGRTTRASKAPSQPQTMTKYLEQGHWFLSLYNDDGDPQEVTLTGDVSSEFTEGCPRGCSGNGDCILGSCQCHPGFAGPDCTQMMCPVLCSGNGEYRDGECVCRPGWKGRECSIRHDECEVPDCNGHGHCVDGRCRCAKGYKGDFCEEDDCPHPTCSGHGWCVSGTCVCQRGWRGPDCGSTDDAALQCLPDCNGHGHFDLESHQCICEPEWTGSECSKRVCGLDCGLHGRCEGGACLCTPGWTGDRCNLMTCDPRCEEHGQCKNGTCICMTGWNGRHCTLAGCPSDCSGNGACVMEKEEWMCRCQNDWEGYDCSVKLETDCDDNKDNDGDGLVDCADAECCSTTPCHQSTLCLTSVDPIDILLRKQPPAVTASFFQRMRFIVEEGSVQNYAEGSAFNASMHRTFINESRASVVRGRVISGRGTGLRGVRVSHYRPADTGFTLTRPGGWFDLMVNGGGAVRLLFGKSPFLPVTETVWVPWNEIVVTNTIVMTVADVVPPPPPTPCPDHNYDALKPVVLATWKHGFQGGCPECSAILTESQVVQESLSIPGTGLHLVYHSSRALGYESTIQLQLTPSVIPETLRRIYLRITIEGILFEKTFEADPDIKFTYAWNRLNVYRQRVYGVTWAVVKVGFAYSNCDQVIWDAQTTQVSGHDMSISDIGGWDLSIHHRYNFHEGILQKGDGRNMHMKQKPRVLQTLMGDGHQREVSCRACDGPADKQRLLTPAALASGPDGSLYIADFNLIRRVLPDNTVKTVVKLNETRVSYRYHLAVSPVTGDVYISDHEAHLILKVRDPDDFASPEENYMPYVGSGERCLPGDEVGCGDNSLARDAKLQYPKGMALSFNDVLYFADGTNVRAVDADGIINTVIGTHRHRAHWRPLPCEGTVPVSEVSLRWPTALAISPLDDSLYVLDDHHVLRLTHDGQIKVVAGRPLHCPPLGHDVPSDLAAHTTLRSPQSLTFAPNGDLYIAESDNERINRVRVIETDERIHDFAGADSKCNCQEESCPCYDESHVLAATAVFSTISALAVTPDGTVHVLDQGNLRIRSVTSSIPEPNAQRMYEIYSPETQEVYIFNRFGHHVETRSIPTGRTIYMFAYNVNTSNGKLSTVTDAGGNRVSFLRDYTGQVTMIENSRQQKCRLQMSRTRRLEELVTPDEHNVTLTYHGALGLLRSRMDSTGRAHVYTYDIYGRLTRTVTPSGQVIDLSFDLSQKGARVTVTRDGTAPITMLIKGALVTQTIGSASSVTAQLPDGSVVTRTAWGHHIATETVPYTLLQDHTLAHSFPVSGRQRTEIGDELVNSFDWKYFVETSDQNGPVTQVGRKMRVNGEDLLTFKYDLYTGTEAVLNEAGVTLLNVSYDPLGRPLRWTPAQPFLPVEMSYDRFGQLEHWSWGDMKEEYSYDRNGRFEGVTYADGSKVMYSFKDISSVKPYKVSVSSGAEHLLEHDEGGALSAVTTPRGHKYAFHVQPSLLHNRFTFTPPGSPRHPYQLFYSDDGRKLAEILPHQASRVIYHYDGSGRLHQQLFGDGSVEYGYHAETGLLRTVSVRERGFELRSDNKYHAGLVKEQRVRFGESSGLDSAKLRFLYDGNARPRRVEVEINGKEQPDYDMKYDMILGTLDSVGDLKVTSSYHNKTVVQDVRKTMLRVTGYDPHGRIVEAALTLRSRMVHRRRYTYDSRGRLATMSTWRGPGSLEIRNNYTYTPDGFLQAVDGAESWQFRYDKNGNMIAVVEGGREMTATYDGADRLVGWGDVELNTYSPGGTVVRQGEVHLSYSARGNLKSAWQQDQYKIWCRHDHHGRLTVWEDDHGNVTQFFYADLLRPNLPTHIHYPKQGETHSLEYDERGHLMALHTGRHRLWVSTDHLGSPVAVFDDSGVLVKEIVRSPWGATLSDSRPDLLLHVDFQGSLRDPVTGFLVFGLHTYDPVHAQWMAPRYDLVTSAPNHVGAVYVHRFHDNDPVNLITHQPRHYTDLDSWLKLFGVDLSKMLGSSYHDETVEKQRGGLLKASQLAPSLSVISGLSCSTGGVLRQFSRPSLLPESLVRSNAPAWAIPGWAALGRFSSSPPVLGPGVLVSRVNGRALVSLVPSRENPVVQDVARDVLNGSALLDVTLTHHHHHTLYLVKENAELRHDDLQQLQRLSGRFNVSAKENEEHHEIRVVGSDVSLVLLYGVDPSNARHRLLRHAHRRAVDHAWENERLLLERGSPTTHEWTVEERVELISKGTVPGYMAADMHSIHRYPLLADDPTNVVFRRDTGRRRRRSQAGIQS